jgi:hypothetical protein
VSVLWSEVPEFAGDRECPKCRHRSCADWYHGADEDLALVAGARGRLNWRLCAALDQEHLHRICKGCDYERLERTADQGVTEQAT